LSLFEVALTLISLRKENLRCLRGGGLARLRESSGITIFGKKESGIVVVEGSK
jgi:hypothetical protein